MEELWIFLLSALPLLELRGAIPVAIGVFKFSYFKAFFISFLGNIIIIIPLIWFLENLSGYLIKKSKMAERFFAWLFDKTRKKIKGGFLKWGKWVLVIFVAIPLPFTGAWSGSIAAFLFGLDKKTAFWLISLGVFLAGMIVTGVSFLGINFLK